MYKIVRLSREIEGNLEERIYLKTKEGYIPLWIPTGQIEEFKFSREEEIGTINLPNAKSIIKV